MFKFMAIGAVFITLSSACFASDSIPRTNFGSILKVPVSEVERVEKGLNDWANWIKETHPMGEEEMGLDSLTVTKSDTYMGHVFYAVVEIYRTTEAASNHQALYRRDVATSKYGPMIGNLSFFNEFRIKGTKQKKTLISITPQVNFSSTVTHKSHESTSEI